MSYDLHITRRNKWNDPNGPTISADEWLAVLDADPELLRSIDADENTIGGSWNGRTVFLLANGEVISRNPDEATIRKMVQIAKSLDATVQGDDGEKYPDALKSTSIIQRRSLWRRIFGG